MVSQFFTSAPAEWVIQASPTTDRIHEPAEARHSHLRKAESTGGFQPEASRSIQKHPETSEFPVQKL